MSITTPPKTDAFWTVRPQITFFQQNYIDETCSVVTYAANATHIVPTCPNLPVIVTTLRISEASILYRDQQFQEFLIGQEHCHNFINQDLTFLQPSTVYDTMELDDRISTASDSIDASVITVQENKQPQEKDNTSSHSSSIELSYDSTRIGNRPAPIQLVEPVPIQPVEPVIDLTTEEQCLREQDPSLTIYELLGLSSCEDHIRNLFRL